MKKYIIIAVVFTACLSLCAAMWPQSEMVEETPSTIQATVVSAPAPTDENIVAETETTPPTEEEKIEIPFLAIFALFRLLSGAFESAVSRCSGAVCGHHVVKNASRLKSVAFHRLRMGSVLRFSLTAL